MPSNDDDSARARARYTALEADRERRADAIRAGALPNLREVLSGLPFAFDNVALDIATWCAATLMRDDTGPLPVAVQRRLRALAADPDDGPLRALRRAASKTDKSWSLVYAGRLRSIVDRCDVYLAHFEDVDACLRTGALAFNLWRLEIGIEGTPTGKALITRVLTDNHFARTGLAGDKMTRNLVRDLNMELASPPPETAAETRVRVYAGSVADLPDDLDVLDDGHLDDDRLGVVRLPEPPGLTVLRSVSHLPGTAEDGSKPKSSASARAEYAPLAGKRLLLVHDADIAVVAATVRSEWPWAADVTDALLSDLVGRPWTRLRPTLFLGTPGSGKTRYARRLGELLGLAVTLYPCAGVHDGAFGGTSRQWSTGRASVSLQAIRRAMVANPLVVLDEIEKVGTRRENGSLQDCLVPLLEPESAARYHDQYLECDVDLSAVSYLATANSLDGIPGPLLDRFRVLHVPEPGPEHLGDVARRIVDELRRERGLGVEWMPDLEPDELELVGQHWPGGSLRRLRRLVETVIVGRDTLAARH